VSRACGTSATSASNPDTGRPTVHSTTTSRLQPTAVISKPVQQQNSLTKLLHYCDEWGLQINISKTKSLVFNNSIKSFAKIYKTGI
jgi:hypothetical protein